MLGWWRAHKAREAVHDEFRRALVEEQAQRVLRGDEDALELARSVANDANAGALAQTAIWLYMILLVVTVVPLIGLFWLIKQWVG